jgi:hypothetical protein
MNNYAVNNLRAAAVSCHVDFTYEEFASLLPNLNAIDQTDTNWKFQDEHDEKKLKILHDLANMASSLSWVYYNALIDFLFAIPEKAFSSTDMYVEWLAERLKHCIENGRKNKRSYDVQAQIIALKLYKFAVSLVPWDNKRHIPQSPSSELDFLRDAIVEGDTWATFIGFSEKWRNLKNTHALACFLPPIYGFDDEDTDVTIENTIPEDTDEDRRETPEQQTGRTGDQRHQQIRFAASLITIIEHARNKFKTFIEDATPTFIADDGSKAFGTDIELIERLGTGSVWLASDGRVRFSCEIVENNPSLALVRAHLDLIVRKIVDYLKQFQTRAWEITEEPLSEPYCPRLRAVHKDWKVEIQAYIIPRVDNTFDASLNVQANTDITLADTSPEDTDEDRRKTPEQQTRSTKARWWKST